MCDVKDYYFMYVMKAGINEDVFWNADISFIRGLLANINAYDKWLSYRQYKLEEMLNGK